jgi:hypothetical protein
MFHFRLAAETRKKINGGKTFFSILELLKRFYFFEMVSIKEMFPGSFSRKKNVCFGSNKKKSFGTKETLHSGFLICLLFYRFQFIRYMTHLSHIYQNMLTLMSKSTGTLVKHFRKQNILTILT